MTIAFEPALISQAMTAQASPLTGHESAQERGGLPFQFADLLASRAFLDAPVAAPRAGLDARYGTDLQEALAPVALRFDEAPLFGRAFLATLGGPSPTDTAPAGHGPVVEAALTASASADALDAGPVNTRSGSAPAPFPLTTHDATAFGFSAMFGEGRGGLVSWRGIEGVSRGATGSRSPAGLPADRAAFAMVRTPAALRPSALIAVSPEEGTSGAARDTALDARARFLNHLGPVHLTIRQEDLTLIVTTRVSGLHGDEEEALERRLRNAVHDADRSLRALIVNGAVRPQVEGA